MRDTWAIRATGDTRVNRDTGAIRATVALMALVAPVYVFSHFHVPPILISPSLRLAAPLRPRPLQWLKLSSTQ